MSPSLLPVRAALFAAAVLAGAGGAPLLRADPVAAAAPPGVPVAEFSDISSWRVQTAGQAEAELQMAAAGPGEKPTPALVVTVGTIGSGEPWVIQLARRMPLEKGKTYHVSFQAKAEPERKIVCGAMQDHAPYLRIGKPLAVSLGAEWTKVSFDFVPEADEPQARISISNLAEPGLKITLAAPAMTVE
ncbi:MAG TPA: carbohydrate binding domain-containing protein [Candidatus Methylacidiphilales bacterium]